jgi:hypothetical protein
MRRSNMGSFGNRNNRNQRSRGMKRGGSQRYMPSRSTSFIYLLGGGALALPQAFDMFILGNEYHSFSFIQILMMLGFIVGTPVCLFGAILFLCRNNNSHTGSLIESDVARIRYAQETQARRDM